MNNQPKRICPRCGGPVTGAKNKIYCKVKHRYEFNMYKHFKKGQVTVSAPKG